MGARLAAAAAGLALLGAQAQAQPPGAAQTAAGAAGAPTEGAELQEVIVTGSYIPRTDTETPSPVTVITNADIAAAQYTSSADVVRNLLSADNSGTLPTAFPGAFAAGASGVALRGLTVNSTLVLIDGLRAADYALPDDGVRSFVDLNSIPIGTIDHIETLQDGASSTYGADAIAGVVNIILKKTVQGFSANAEIGDSQHGGGFEKHLDFTWGFGDLANDKYNFYIASEYNYDNAIGVWERPFPYTGGFLTGNFTQFGGANLQQQPQFDTGSIYGSVAPATLSTPGNVLTGTPVLGKTGVPLPTQPLQPCPATAPRTTDTTPSMNVFCNQNQNVYLDDAPPEERVGLSARFTAQINDKTQAYLETSYYQNQSQFPGFAPAQIQTTAPHPTTTIALPATIPAPGYGGTCTTTTPTANCVLNPNDPFAAAGEAALINYAFGDLGPEETYVKNHSLRLVGDLTGLEYGWNYDLSFVIHHTWLDYELGGFVLYNQLITDVTDGTYNFVDPAANSPAVRNALAPRLTQQDSSDMDTVVGRVNRPLFDLPGGPLQVALGAEWRYEAEYDGNFNADANVEGLGFSQAIGSREIASADAEFDAPLLKSLELNIAGRFDHYSDFGNTFNPKFGLKFKPIDMIAVRGTYSRGFRAPSFAESGNSEVEGFVPYGACPSPLCTAHGADGYISSYTLGELTTANPHIKPERSDSYTTGIVLSPVKTFTATFDYYYIKKTELIGTPNQSEAMAQYAQNFTLPPGFTAFYDFADPSFPSAPPRIVTIIAPYFNGASEYTDGVDIDLRLNFKGPYGTITSDLSATKILSFVYEQAGQPNLQYVGFQSPYNLSSGAGTPQYRANWINTWTQGPWTASVIVHYVSGYKEYGQDLFGVSATNTVQYLCIPAVIGQGFTPPDCRVGSFTDIDLTAQYNITQNLAVSAAIDNVADIPPPVDTANYAGQSYNPTYTQAGLVGRFFRVGVHWRM